MKSADGEIDFRRCKFTNVRIISPDVDFSCEACRFKNIQITPSADSRDDYRGFVYIDTMENEGNVLISDINIFKPIRITGKIRGSITISNVLTKSPDAFIDLSGVRAFKTGEKVRLNLIEAPWTSIKLNYTNFILDDSIKIHPEIANATYINLLDNFKKRGQTEDYENLDIEYQHYKYITRGNFLDRLSGRAADFIDRWWWNYGYSRGYILLWTIGLVLLFSFINKFLYQKLNGQVYTITSLNCEGDRSFYKSLLYTSIIFFSISLSIERLKFDSKKYFFWFGIIYIIGVICLAYTINFVLKAGQPVG